MKRAFTLIEVNLAILIMAGGILAMVSLYSFGYRENSQSREDVAGAAIADAVMSPLVMACSATNLKWSVFKNMPSYPSDGWADYFNENTGIVEEDPQDKAKDVFERAMSDLKEAAIGELDVNKDFPTDAFPSSNGDKGKMSCGLVIIHKPDSPIVKIAFRATHKPGMLLSMPIYYTEARFQGDPNQ